MSRRSVSAFPAETCRAALQSASLLLTYPERATVDAVPLLTAVAGRLPEPVAGPLRSMAAHVASTPLPQLQQHYTEIFDLRRRCAPYLTYFSHGDTRQRGMALLRFSHAYRTAGAEPVPGELPDHLAVVCEFAAATDLEGGLRLLREHRAAIELIRRALAEADSPYVAVLDLVRAVLPEAAPRDLAKALELARTGPPEETVGLEPFGPPELMGARR